MESVQNCSVFNGSICSIAENAPDEKNQSTYGMMSSLDYPRAYGTVLYLLILVVGVVGNVMVMLVIAKNKDMRNSTNIFLFSLSVADLLCLVSELPSNLLEIYEFNLGWTLTYMRCNVVRYLGFISADVSSATILAISLDRYMAICRPMSTRGKLTTKRGVVVSATLWLLIGVTNIYAFFSFEVVELVDDRRYETNAALYVCRFVPHLEIWARVFDATSYTFFYFVPLIIVTVFYTLVMRKLIRTKPMCSTTTEAAEKYRERKQVVYMVGMIALLYFVLLFPLRLIGIFITTLRVSIPSAVGAETAQNMFYIFTSLLYLNSAINPIVYNLMSRRFRTAFLDVLHCRSSDQLQ